MLSGLHRTALALLFGLFLLPSAAFASFNRPLSLGSTGPDVSALQTLLKDKGFFSMEATGYFGNVTKDALAAYQASVGLEAVGAVGPKTLALLNGTVPSTTLSTLITSLQQLLRNAGYFEVSLTGVLDPATLAAAQSVSSGTGTAPKRSGGKPQRSEDEEEAPASDTTTPTLSSITSSPSQTSVTISWTTDEDADSHVDLGPTTSYGTASTSATFSTFHSLTFTGLTASTAYHFRVQSTDASSNTATSSDQTFTTSVTPDATPPVLSAIASSTATSTATITWTTDEASDSRVDFGPTASYGTASTSATLATSHSITLTGLTPSTTYHFRVQSADAANNVATSSDRTFVTGAEMFLRQISNQSGVPETRYQATTANRMCYQSRTKHVITDDVSAIQIVLGSYYVDTSEHALGNDMSVEVAIEVPGVPTVTVRGLYGGNATGTLANGTAKLLSDPILASSFGLSSFTRGTVFWLRQRKQVASLNDYFTATGPSTVTGEVGFLDGCSTSQLMNTGAMTTGGADYGQGVNPNRPLAIVGYVPSNISVLGIGDSIMHGSNDNATDGNNGGGWFARGLNSVGGRTIAWGRVSRGGTTAQQYASTSAFRSALYPYFTHAVVHYGTNDAAASGRTAAQTRLDLQSIFSELSLGGITNIQFSQLFPRDTSISNSCATPITGFSTGGAFRDPLNAAIASDVGSYGLTGVFDMSSVIADATFPDRWVASSTSDCIHPSPAASVSLGSAFAVQAAAYVAR